MKKGQIATGIYVFLALGLSFFAIYVFITHSGKVENEILDSSFLDSVYLKEDELNFYIDFLMERSVRGVEGEEEFILRFKEELENYNIADEFLNEKLKEVAMQVDSESVEFSDEGVSFDLSIKIGDSWEGFKVSYFYEERFEKIFK